MLFHSPATDRPLLRARRVRPRVAAACALVAVLAPASLVPGAAARSTPGAAGVVKAKKHGRHGKPRGRHSVFAPNRAAGRLSGPRGASSALNGAIVAMRVATRPPR